MKTAKPTTQRRSQASKRSFTWGIKAADISFMRVTDAEAAMEGSSGGSDCSAISNFDPVQHRKATPPAKH
jgi:hypothetical protein